MPLGCDALANSFSEALSAKTQPSTLTVCLGFGAEDCLAHGREETEFWDDEEITEAVEKTVFALQHFLDGVEVRQLHRDGS